MKEKQGAMDAQNLEKLLAALETPKITSKTTPKTKKATATEEATEPTEEKFIWTIAETTVFSQGLNVCFFVIFRQFLSCFSFVF
jgi:hypothetical protein